MKDLVKNLLEQLRGTSAGTKLVAALAGASLLAIVTLVALASGRRHLEPGFANVSDAEVGKVTKALADAGITFDLSAPPGPYVVFVDEADRYRAKAAVYGADALSEPIGGIRPGGGLAGVLGSAAERRQVVRKRDQEEVELMLVQGLRYVQRAEVRTSVEPGSSAVGQDPRPVTAAVTVHVDAELTPSQKAGIARIVINALGIDREHLVVLDQQGRTLYDGAETDDGTRPPSAWLDWRFAHDDRLTGRANRELERILGPNRARVSVLSEWNHETSTSRTESESGDAILISESTDLASRTYRPVTSLVERTNATPSLSRLSVALALDASVDPELAAQLGDVVKSMVGFDEARGDGFSSTVLTFFVPEREELAEAGTTNQLLETVLQHGVELLAALAFVWLLLRSLGSSKDTLTPAERAERPEQDVDLDRLAQANVDELLRSDPDRVGEVLARWARGGAMTESRS